MQFSSAVKFLWNEKRQWPRGGSCRMLSSNSSGDSAATGRGVTPSRSGRKPSRTRVRYLRQISGLVSRANCAASVSRKTRNGMSVGWRSALSCPAACARWTSLATRGALRGRAYGDRWTRKRMSNTEFVKTFGCGQ